MSATTAQLTVPPFIRTADTDITFITETISVNKPHSSPHLRPGMRLGFSLFRRPPSPLPHTFVKIFHHRGEQIFNHTAFAGFDFGGYAHTGL